MAAKVNGVHEIDTYYVCIFRKKEDVDVKEGESVGNTTCNCKTMQVVCRENAKVTLKLFLLCNGERVHRVYYG